MRLARALSLSGSARTATNSRHAGVTFRSRTKSRIAVCRQRRRREESNVRALKAKRKYHAAVDGRSLPRGVGIVIQDTGRISFDADDNIIFQAGPHQVLGGTTPDFCSVLV
jgi:hypothetical protein